MKMKRFLLSLVTAALLSGCGEELPAGTQRVLPWQDSHELVVLVQNGPTSLYVGADGRPTGLEYDLANRFAEANKLKVRFVVTSSYAEMMQRLDRGEGHLAVGVARNQVPGKYTYGTSYQAVEPVLIHTGGNNNLLNDVYAGKIKVTVLPRFADVMREVKHSKPGVIWAESKQFDGESLVDQVVSGQIPVALVDQYTAQILQNHYPRMRIQSGFAPSVQLSWAMAPDDARLQQMVNGFFVDATDDGTLLRLYDRYYGHLDRVVQGDMEAFQQRRLSVLPDYREFFQIAERETRVDWRLLAALSYQESRWDPSAISPFGVRGIMMLTTQTAQELGVDRLNPGQSIIGAARYIVDLRSRIPEHISEPDRTWMALAAYNVGMAHLDDARQLAVRLKKNPDSWMDLKTVLPLLRKPEYFSTLKYGFARGGEPVIFVERLRSYYDILARYEQPYKPLRPLWETQFTMVDSTASAIASNPNRAASIMIRNSTAAAVTAVNPLATATTTTNKPSWFAAPQPQAF